MTIEIKEPMLEALIRKRLESGGFQNVEEVLLRALQLQDAEEDWLQENKEAMDESIASGPRQLDHGEGIPGDVPRARMQERKAASIDGLTNS
jgi:Arc/MetJ-type ribon-helix-helix transcriptional regulator